MAHDFAMLRRVPPVHLVLWFARQANVNASRGHFIAIITLSSTPNDHFKAMVVVTVHYDSTGVLIGAGDEVSLVLSICSYYRVHKNEAWRLSLGFSILHED